MRHFLFAIITLVFGFVAAFVVLEAVLRFLPVSSTPMVEPITDDQPIFRFYPDRPYLYSQGWNLKLANSGRTNNAGFVNDQLYERTDDPLLAVIGDSYVEAFMMSYDETLQAHLEQCTGERGRVYSFAASGAPLSQYLVWAQHAREEYGADGLVIVVVNNDFDESLANYKRGPGFHHFERVGDEYQLRLVEYQPNPLRWLVYNSALARYLVFNLNIQNTLANLPARAMHLLKTSNPPPRCAGNTVEGASLRRVSAAKRAVDLFFEHLPQRANLPADRILFVLDGTRPALYDSDTLAEAQDSYFPQMRRYFIQQAQAKGYALIDMQPIFQRQHAKNGTRFEFEHDSHWNPTAHRLVAQQLARARLLEDLFGALECP
jgi:hypothetical protein